MIENLTESIKEMVITFFKWSFTGLANNSFWICLGICMIGLILYVGGIKKAGRYCTASFIIYVFLQALGSALK